jgi:hypothetical protein
MPDPREHGLVMKAFALACGARNYVTGYVEWKAKSAELVRAHAVDLNYLTPEAIREMSIEFVKAGNPVEQREEDRPEWSDFAFSYRIVLPVSGFPRGIFVEFALIDDDPDDPAILIVSAHKQGV